MLFPVQLVLEYLQAHAAKERSTALVADICAHVANTYALGTEERTQLRADVTREARRRGWFPQEDSAA